MSAGGGEDKPALPPSLYSVHQSLKRNHICPASVLVGTVRVENKRHIYFTFKQKKNNHSLGAFMLLLLSLYITWKIAEQGH